LKAFLANKEPEVGTPEFYIQMLNDFEREQLDYKKQRDEAVGLLRRINLNYQFSDVTAFLAKVEGKDAKP
jgi:hypothetical protein